MFMMWPTNIFKNFNLVAHYNYNATLGLKSNIVDYMCKYGAYKFMYTKTHLELQCNY
jgi:hypothetical protein